MEGLLRLLPLVIGTWAITRWVDSLCLSNCKHENSPYLTTSFYANQILRNCYVHNSIPIQHTTTKHRGENSNCNLQSHFETKRLLLCYTGWFGACWSSVKAETCRWKCIDTMVLLFYLITEHVKDTGKTNPLRCKVQKNKTNVDTGKGYTNSSIRFCL